MIIVILCNTGAWCTLQTNFKKQRQLASCVLLFLTHMCYYISSQVPTAILQQQIEGQMTDSRDGLHEVDKAVYKLQLAKEIKCCICDKLQYKIIPATYRALHSKNVYNHYFSNLQYAHPLLTKPECCGVNESKPFV